MKLYKLVLLVFTVMLQSCLSNEIYFDAEEQQICSANSKGLHYLEIESKDQKETYSVRWYNTEKSAPTEICLNDLPSGYDIRLGFDSLADRHHFKLKPNNIYTITRGGGDAGPYPIEVITDNTGDILRQLDPKPR